MIVAGLRIWLSQSLRSRNLIEMGCLQSDLGDVSCQVRTLLVLARQGWGKILLRRGLLKNCRRCGLLRVKGISQQLKVRWDEYIPSTILEYIVVLFPLINHLLANRLNQFRVLRYRLAPQERITFKVSALGATLFQLQLEAFKFSLSELINQGDSINLLLKLGLPFKVKSLIRCFCTIFHRWGIALIFELRQ